MGLQCSQHTTLKHETVHLLVLVDLLGHRNGQDLAWRQVYRWTQFRHVDEWVPVCAYTHEHTHS